MKRERSDAASEAMDGLRKMPKLARCYADNRTLPVLVYLGLFALGFASIGGSSTLANSCLRSGHKAAAVMFGVMALVASALWVWLVATHRLERVGGWLSGRLYGAEGTAVADVRRSNRPRTDQAVVIAFISCVGLSIAAGFASETAYRYLVPIMAAYSIPFLLYIWVRQGGMAVPFMLLWPVLWGIHAVLALAGIPPFDGEPDAVNVLVPTLGYGVIAALASHIYSRIVLRRLRSFARVPETEKEGGGQHA